MNELLMKMPLLHRWFAPKEDSRSAAKNRLKAALVEDRQTVAPQLMNCLRKEIETCVARYLKADSEGAVYKLKDRNGKMTLSVEVPVISVLRQAALPEEALREEPVQKEKAEDSIELRLDDRKLRKGRKRRFRSIEE